MQTDRPWWTVDDAARLLRVNKHTLYRACAADDFPHVKHSYGIRIPAEALGFTVNPATKSRTYHVTDDVEQLALDLGPIVPVRLFRDGTPIPAHHNLALRPY